MPHIRNEFHFSEVYCSVNYTESHAKRLNHILLVTHCSYSSINIEKLYSLLVFTFIFNQKP